LTQIRGVKETGISGKIFLKGSKKTLANVQISIPALGLTTTIDKDGLYEIIPLEASDYTLEIKAEGYKTIVIDNRTLKSGVIGRLNFVLEAIAA
jgi:CarboxypepD_reg-like domain